jgi:hypothetical protein
MYAQQAGQNYGPESRRDRYEIGLDRVHNVSPFDSGSPIAFEKRSPVVRELVLPNPRSRTVKYMTLAKGDTLIYVR